MIRANTLLLAFLRFKNEYKNMTPEIDANIDIMEAFLCKTYDLVKQEIEEEENDT